MVKLSEILEAYQLKLDKKAVPESIRAENYIKLIMLKEDFEKEAKELSKRFTDEDKKDVLNALSMLYNLPEYMTVHDVAEILGVSPQVVRKYCEDGRLIGEQILEGSGNWRIDTRQLIGGNHWREYLLKCDQLKVQSIKVANKMLELIDDLDYE